MARKDRVKAAMFHGEIVAVEGENVSFEGRSLGKPDKGLSQVTPKPTSTVPFAVTAETKIEVDGAEGSLGSLATGQFGVVKAQGTLGSYTATMISVSTEEEEVVEPDEAEGGVVTQRTDRPYK